MDFLNAVMPVMLFFLSIFCGGLGWFASQMWSRIKANEEVLNAHKLAVAENYVRHDRMQEIIKPLDNKISDVQTMVGRLLQQGASFK